eukprot:SM000138S00016  [mRNA]  locus=s138:21691:26788:+ [translate_table: standard]
MGATDEGLMMRPGAGIATVPDSSQAAPSAGYPVAPVNYSPAAALGVEPTSKFDVPQHQSYMPDPKLAASSVIQDQRIAELEAEIRLLQQQKAELIAASGGQDQFQEVKTLRIQNEGYQQQIRVLDTKNVATILHLEELQAREAIVSRGNCFKPAMEEMDQLADAGKSGFRFTTACSIYCCLGGFIQIVSIWILGPAAVVITLAPCYAYEYRSRLRRKYNLKEAPFSDFCTSCVCGPCALCQEARELDIRFTKVEENKLKEKIRKDLAATSATPGMAPGDPYPPMGIRPMPPAGTQTGAPSIQAMANLPVSLLGTLTKATIAEGSALPTAVLVIVETNFSVAAVAILGPAPHGRLTRAASEAALAR